MSESCATKDLCPFEMYSVLIHTIQSEESPNYRVEFVDLVRFDSKGKISQMREFFDSGHIHGHLEHHHKKSQGDERK